MELPESLWSRIAIAAVLAGSAACSGQAAPQLSAPGGASHEPSPGTAAVTESVGQAEPELEPGETAVECEGMPAETPSKFHELFPGGGCPACGMG